MVASLYRWFSIFVVLFLSLQVFAQKRILDHTAYSSWKKLSNPHLSSTGKYVFFEINPYRGDGFMVWYNTETHRYDSLSRAKSTRFSYDGSYLFSLVSAPYDSIHKLKLAETKPELMPKDSLVWIRLENQKATRIANVLEYKIAAKSNCLAYLSNSNEIAGKLYKKARQKLLKKGYSSEGHVLHVQVLETGKSYEWENVKTFELDETGIYLALVKHLKKGNKDSLYLSIVNLKSPGAEFKIDGYKKISHLTWSKVPSVCSKQ